MSNGVLLQNVADDDAILGLIYKSYLQRVLSFIADTDSGCLVFLEIFQLKFSS